MFGVIEKKQTGKLLNASGALAIKIVDYFSENKYGILLFSAYVVSTIVTICASWWTALSYAAGVIEKISFALLLPFIAVCAVLFVIQIRRWRACPERVFLLIALPALLFFAFFLPPNQVPDEIWHIQRVFDYFLPNGGMNVPDCFVYLTDDFPTNYEMLYNAITARSGWGNSIFIEDGFDNYPVYLYVIPGIGADIAELLNLNPFIAVCIARCANALAYIVLGFWMIKILPLGKVLLTVYLLNPMMIQQEASCSPDAFVNIACLLYIAYLVKLLFEEEPTGSQFVLLFILTILMCISKYAYAPLLLLWLLFVKRLKNKRARVLIFSISGITICSLIMGVIFFYDGSRFQPSFELIRNIPEFFSVMFNTGNEMTALWIKETFGMILGSLNLIIWEPCFWAYGLILLFSAVFNLGEKKALRRSNKVFICILVGFLTVFLILIFRQWTLEVDHRSDVIMGVQGRYFLPYFILPLLCLITPKSSLIRPNIMILYSAVLIFIYLVDAVTIIKVFI